jgi:transcriptional regulator with XRE-family HTH domain
MEREELKKWREVNGYSQGRLCRILGVDVMTVSRWERGILKIPPYLKWALAYLEERGDELKPQLKRERKRKGGNENVSIG